MPPILLAEAVADGHKMPPEEQLPVLDKLFAGIAAKRTIHTEIQDSLEVKIPTDRLADTSVAEAYLQLRLSDIRFTRTASGKYAWTLKSVMLATWNRDTRHLKHGYRIYEYTSRSLPLEDWVENDGKILNEALDTCVEGLAEQMAGDIRFKDA